MHEIRDRLHAARSAGGGAKLRPGEIGELVGVAIAARDQKEQGVVGKGGDRGRPRLGRRLVGPARVVNDEAIGEDDEPGGNLDARDPVAEVVEVVAHRERRIGDDPVRRQQVRVPRRMDAELKQHRRRRRTFEGDVEACFDQHWGAPRVAALKGPA